MRQSWKIILSSCKDFENNSQLRMQIPTVFEHTRPDLCVTDHATRTCFTVEVSMPFDVFVHECYQNKFIPLTVQAITEKGYDCKIIVLIVASLGSAHCRFVSGLRLIGIPTSSAKRIAKYCSVSTTIGSRIIWKQRCRSML